MHCVVYALCYARVCSVHGHALSFFAYVVRQSERGEMPVLGTLSVDQSNTIGIALYVLFIQPLIT